MLKLNDESLKTVVGGEFDFTCTKEIATLLSMPGAGIGACTGIIMGSLSSAASSKKYAEEKHMGFAKKTITVVTKVLVGAVSGGICGALIGAASGAAVGAGFGMSADVITQR